jgi:sulfatase maturation enzyme AslB (radical SAM superfamily)
MSPPFKRLTRFLKHRTPGQLVIQMSDHCNAFCPQCGMRRSGNFKRSRLSVDTIKHILDACVEKGVEAVSFTGGEPLLFFDDLIDCLKHASHCGIKYTRTGTNGFIFMHSGQKTFKPRIHRIAEQLVFSGIYTFWISLDSAVPEVHESMRGLPGVVKGIEQALPIFAEYGLYPSVNLGINRNIAGKHLNRNGFQKDIGENSAHELTARQTRNHSGTYLHFRRAFGLFYQRVIDMGFTIVNACYPMTSNGDSSPADTVYQATSSADIVSFRREEKIDLFHALFDTIPEFRNVIRIFTPRSSLLHLIRQYSSPSGSKKIAACRGGIDYFYIDAATGQTYPCGYRGTENLGNFQSLNLADLPSKAFCTRCDWECFRDPSVMFDPLLILCHNPMNVIGDIFKDSVHYKLWLEDILYYRKCRFFCGRTPGFTVNEKRIPNMADFSSVPK